MTTHTKPKAESQIFTDEQMKIINSIKLPKASDKVSFDTTKPKSKPNGWETFGFYTKNKTLKRINEMMCSAGVYQETRKSILSKIHQAILSAEEAKVRKAAQIVRSYLLMSWATEEDVYEEIETIAKKIDSLSLPDQGIKEEVSK